MNINTWAIMLPVFLVEAICLGFLLRSLKASRLGTALIAVVSLLHGVAFFMAVWHDSRQGIIQLAEDLTYGSESPIAAFLFISFGTVIVSGLVALGHLLLVCFSAESFNRRQRAKLLASKRVVAKTTRTNVPAPKAAPKSAPKAAPKKAAKTSAKSTTKVVAAPVRDAAWPQAPSSAAKSTAGVPVRRVEINHFFSSIKHQIGDKLLDTDEPVVIIVDLGDDQDNATA